MPGTFRFEPCPSCCTPAGCVYFSDAFDRDDNTDLGANWTETAGDWSISSNRLAISASDALVECNTTHPTSSIEYIVTVSVALGTNGDCIRVYIDDGAYYAELERITSTCGRLRLYDGEACLGSVTVALGGYTRLVVCSEGDKVHVGTGGAPMLTVAASVSTSVVQLATETCGGTIYFEDFSLSKHAEDDATCPACGSEGCVWFRDTGCSSGSLPAVDWTTTGTWSYANDVRCTADGTAAILPAMPFPSQNTRVFFGLTPSGSTAPLYYQWPTDHNGVVLKLYPDATNANLYVKAEVASNTWYISLWNSGTQVGPTYSPNTTYSLWTGISGIGFCWDGTTLTAEVVDYTHRLPGLAFSQCAPTITAIAPEMDVSGIVSKPVGFSVSCYKLSADVTGCADCTDPPCVACEAGTFSPTAEVVIADITSVDYGCTCTDVTIPLAATITGCCWSGIATGPCSSGTWTASACVAAVTGGYKLSVTVTTSTGVSATFENSVVSGSPVDCMTAFDGDVPLVSSSGTLHCTLESATCTFTSPEP